MGCSSSKHVCGDVYREMQRRLRVGQTRNMDADTRRELTHVFERIAAGADGNTSGMSGSRDDSGTGRDTCVSLEQLRAYDRENWQLTRIHTYNATLMVDALEDILYLVNGMSSGHSAVLRRCDYRMWLLYMCEFYHVMEVFEGAKLLKGGSWGSAVITEKKLEKCLKVLTSQFNRAFTSERGPGYTFHSPTSITAAAVMEQVVKWWQHHPLKTQTATTTTIRVGGGDSSAKDVSTLSIQLVIVVRWILLRYVGALCNEEDTLEGETNWWDFERNMEKGSWNNIFSGKQQKLRDTLDDITLLEQLFTAMTHGTRELSERDAKNGCYNIFEMTELFKTRSFHDELVEVAFRRTLREVHIDNDLCITELSRFARFLEAYTDALELYYHVIAFSSEHCDTKPMYGEPAPDLEREILSHVLQVLKENIHGERRSADIQDDSDGFISKLFRYFATEREDGVRRVPFLNFADAWIARHARGQGKPDVRDISELFHALGLHNEKRRGHLLAVLTSNDLGHANTAAKTFEVLNAEVNLSQYCNAEELALSQAREQWRMELERHDAATVVYHNTEEILPDTTEKSQALKDILLLRLLHGIYGTFAAVQALENAAADDDGTPSMTSDYSSWESATPVPLTIGLRVLQKTDEMLGMSCVTGEVYTQDTSNRDVKEKIVLCSTAASLLQYIGNRYVDNQMTKWGWDAWKRLQDVWPVRDDDTRRREIFNILTNEGIREVRVAAAEEEMNPGGIHYIPFETLYLQYASELGCIMSMLEFQQLCSRAVRMVGTNTPLCLSEEEEVHAFLRYLIGYMRVLLSLAVPFDESRNVELTISWAELQHWLSQEAGIVMDEGLTYIFEEEAEFMAHRSPPALTTEADANPDQTEKCVRVRVLADWFASYESCPTTPESQLHIWLTDIRDRLPIQNTLPHMTIRRTLAASLSAEDDYIPTAALTRTLRSDHSLWRVWPPKLGPGFVGFAVRETNEILRRPDLQGTELHRTDLRFVLRFIYTYLNVLLCGEHIMREASQLPTEIAAEGEKDAALRENTWMMTEQEEEAQPKSVLSSSSLSWKDSRLHAALHILLEDTGLEATPIMDTIHRDSTNDWTTFHLALVVARASVATALAQYMETQANALQQQQQQQIQEQEGRTAVDPMWYRLRQRLPIGDSLEERMRRKRLFARMRRQKLHYLTLGDLHHGITDVLTLQEFREELGPILFRAFFATKEVTFEQQDVIYLTKNNEHFITAAEFRAFLWYVYYYFQMYYMFDRLCALPENHGMQKTITAAAFAASKPLLKSWGLRVNDAAMEFASISRKCRDDGAIHFTQFAIWASQHHLSPERYSHEETELLVDEKAAAVVEAEAEKEEKEKGGLHRDQQ